LSLKWNIWCIFESTDGFQKNALAHRSNLSIFPGATQCLTKTKKSKKGEMPLVFLESNFILLYLKMLFVSLCLC
jgi:hypothetical protein